MKCVERIEDIQRDNNDRKYVLSIQKNDKRITWKNGGNEEDSVIQLVGEW